MKDGQIHYLKALVSIAASFIRKLLRINLSTFERRKKGVIGENKKISQLSVIKF